MGTLHDTVQRAIAGLGLIVEEDRGGLLVRADPNDEGGASVWVDEGERVVRAEEVIAYPVDPSAALADALDRLNRTRAGVTYSIQEAEQSVVASTVWTSPARDPAPNQLHLLFALLARARDEDGPDLQQVAAGQANADAVDDDEIKFTTSRLGKPASRGYDVYDTEPRQERDEPGWVEPPTRPLGSIGAMDYGDADGAAMAAHAAEADWEEDPDWDTALATRAESGPPTRPQPKPTLKRSEQPTQNFDRGEVLGPPAGRQRRAERAKQRTEKTETVEPPRGSDGLPPRKTSRQALALAISSVEKQTHAKVDLTTENRSLPRRLAKNLVILAIVGGLGFVAWDRIIGPLVGGSSFDLPDLSSLLSSGDAPQVDPDAERKRRDAMPPGVALLALEINTPIRGSDQLDRCLAFLGADAQAAVEALVGGADTDEARVRAYELWERKGYGSDPAARLKLLELLERKGHREGKAVDFVVTDIKTAAPPDAAISDCLSVLKPGDAWLALIDLLGRPGPGAEQRAKILARQLDQDRADNPVLKAMIRTGSVPPGAAKTLVDERGLAWAAGAGRELLHSIAETAPEAMAELVAADDEEVALLGLDLLAASKSPDRATPTLVSVVRRTDLALRLRLRATLALGQLAATSATWELVKVMIAKGTDEALVQEIAEVLRGFPEGAAVAVLQPHLDHDKATVRYYAVRGLTTLQGPASVTLLVQRVQKEPNAQVRGHIVRALEELQAEPSLKGALERGLAIYRSLARRDPDKTVRALARRLYISLTGHEP